MPGYATGYTAYFQKRHYEALAAAIQQAKETLHRTYACDTEDMFTGMDIVVKALSLALAQDNPAFDERRFRDACGL